MPVSGTPWWGWLLWLPLVGGMLWAFVELAYRIVDNVLARALALDVSFAWDAYLKRLDKIDEAARVGKPRHLWPWPKLTHFAYIASGGNDRYTRDGRPRDRDIVEGRMRVMAERELLDLIYDRIDELDDDVQPLIDELIDNLPRHPHIVFRTLAVVAILFAFGGIVAFVASLVT